MIGVMPGTFQLPTSETRHSGAHSRCLPHVAGGARSVRDADQFEVLGRLKPARHASMQAPDRDLRVVAARLRDTHPVNRNLDVRVEALVRSRRRQPDAPRRLARVRGGPLPARDCLRQRGRSLSCAIGQTTAGAGGANRPRGRTSAAGPATAGRSGQPVGDCGRRGGGPGRAARSDAARLWPGAAAHRRDPSR